ncbi:MAG: O-antigen ligase family protein [Phycisphaeraceae bacterium]|nr:O-antigen ligase family protein [Phycisphaeraceae bacterium]
MSVSRGAFESPALAAARLRERVALVVLAGVASARGLVTIAPALRFDSDPALVPGAFAGMGPSGSLLLDAIGAAAIAMLAAARLRASRLSQAGVMDPRASTREGVALLIILALLPLPAFVAQSMAHHADFANFWRGATWLVAAMAAVLVAGSDRAGRAIVAGALIGAAAAMTVRGANQFLVEHPALVSDFERVRESFFASRGWTPGSPAALAYERRLRQPEATGWFGLANVLSGVLLSAALLAALLAWSERRGSEARAVGRASSASRARSGAVESSPREMRLNQVAGLACAVLALGSLALVIMNGSKGAFAVLVLAVAATGLLVWRRSSGPAPGWVPRLLLVLVFTAPVVAFIRGGLLGETTLGERSMLFRWHYLIGSARAFVEVPLIGTGVGGFQDAYVRNRPWFSPEEVTSAHGAFVDWMVSFGAGGAGLVVLALFLLRASLRGAARDEDEPDAPTAQERSALGSAPGFALLAAALGALLALALTSSSDHAVESLSVRLLGSVIATVMAPLAARLVLRGGRVIALALAVSAWALLTHAQVDMDFWLPGSAWWCWLLLGTAAAGAGSRPPSRADRPMLALVGVLSLAAAMALAVVSMRAGIQERSAERAAQSIEEAAATGEPLPRRAAAMLLEESTQAIPGNALPWLAAVEQGIRAVETVPPSETTEREALAREALDRAERAFRSRPELATARLLVDAHALVAIESRRDARGTVVPGPGEPDEDAALREAIDTALRRDPRSLGMLRRMAEINLLLSDTAGAERAARRALEVNESFTLDPLRQLAPADRAFFERLISAAPSTPASPRD